MGERMMPPGEVRRAYGGDLTATGDVAGRFACTSEGDRQILADSEAAGARFLVTENVDDFAQVDLFAVHADLFRVTPEQDDHRESAVLFRGSRCLLTERVVTDPEMLVDGVLHAEGNAQTHGPTSRASEP